MLKSMKKVQALSRLAGGIPHGCNVGIIKRGKITKRLVGNRNFISTSLFFNLLLERSEQ